MRWTWRRPAGARHRARRRSISRLDGRPEGTEMAMNSFFSGGALRSPLRSVVGCTFRLAARLVDCGISKTPPAAMERPEDVFGRPLMTPRLPGETQAERPEERRVGQEGSSTWRTW